MGSRQKARERAIERRQCRTIFMSRILYRQRTWRQLPHASSNAISERTTSIDRSQAVVAMKHAFKEEPCCTLLLFSKPPEAGLALCTGTSCKKRCAGCWFCWSRLAFWAARFFLEKRHQNTRWSRVTAPVDLEPPKGLKLGLGLGFRLRSGWSGPTCKAEIDHTPPAQSFL